MNQIAVTSHTSLLSPQIWQVMREQAAVLVNSQFLPNSIKTPEQAIAIMMKGLEVGLPPMQAFAHINIIQGKPCVSAEGQLALIYKHCPGAKIDFIRLEDDCCVIEASRPAGKKTTFKFDRKDAEAAGLLGKETWKKYPRSMYRSRCISEMARTLFADAIMGLSYTPEELNPDVEVSENGEVIDIPAEPKKPQQEALPKGKEGQSNPIVKNFNSADPKHLDWLEKKLVEKNVATDKHDAIATAYNGKPFQPAALDDVIEQITLGTPF